MSSMSARENLAKAMSLLASSSEENIRFAALHLRMCMELITYEKLESYSGRIPQEVQRRWQPPQAVRALLEFEPEADQDFEVHVSQGEVEDLNAISDVTWLHLGTQKTLAAKWLGKHYNKIGGFLHASVRPESAQLDVEAAVKYLLEVCGDLTEALSGTLSGSPFPVATFECVVCGSTVARNSEALRRGKLAKCFNSQCGTEYKAKFLDDATVSFQPILEYPLCSKCNTPMPTRPAIVDIGSKLTCPGCRQVHHVLGRKWLYGIVET